MRGRTVASVLRAVELWHRRLGREVSGGRLQWRKSAFGDFRFAEGTEPSRNMRIWRIRELLSSQELIAEGRRMHHCVSSYAASCHGGKCSIWSSPRRLRPAHRRRAGHRERGHPLRRRRGHRLPHEADRARSAAAACAAEQPTGSRAPRGGDALRRRRGVQATGASTRCMDEDWSVTPGHRPAQGQGLAPARHQRQRQPLRRVRRRSTLRSRDARAWRPGAYLALLSPQRQPRHGREVADHYSKLRDEPAPGAAAGTAAPRLARPGHARRARSTGRRWS